MCIRVDLPEPEGPMMATYSPRATSMETPCSASTSTDPVAYVLPTSTSLRIGELPS